jgi:homoserine acetyltransferase
MLLAFARVAADKGDLFRRYSAIMNDRAWNRSLTALYQTRSYEAGLQGARTLIALTERFKEELDARGYERNLIRIALLELTCLDRLDWLQEYLDTWNNWQSTPLPLYYKLSRRRDARIRPFILDETNQSLFVHFLYLTRARKELIEKKIGTAFREHARQGDLTEGEMRNRLDRLH